MRRTASTLGVLSIVFGSLVALISGGQLAVDVSGVEFSKPSSFMRHLPAHTGDAQRPEHEIVVARMEPLMRALAPYREAIFGGKLALSLVLIAIGYGMTKARRWSRSGALAWSVLALLFLAVEAIVTISIIQPRTTAVMRELFASMPNGPGSAMMRGLESVQTVGTLIVTLGLYAPFPIVLLGLCGRRSAAADFTD